MQHTAPTHNISIDLGPRQIFLHSPRRDFAETQWMSEADYLGRSLRSRSRPLTFFGCGCGTKYLVRIRRAHWMRLLPLMRHYKCLRCESRILRRGLPYRTPYGAAYLSPAPLRPINQRLHEVAQLTSVLVRAVRP
jgi:hypothetical protein